MPTIKIRRPRPLPSAARSGENGVDLPPPDREPPVDELTVDQTLELKVALQTLRHRLEIALEAGADGVKPVDLGLPIGRLSRMDALQQQNMAVAGRRSAETRLQQVRAALVALAEEHYGYCRQCSEPVGYRRLVARPETPFCLECQAGFEGGL